MLRAIREIQPTWVVGENVLGIVNWNGGLVFDEVQADLEAEGYEVQTYVLPAAGVNAPHQRYRVWFVAYSKSSRSGFKQYKKCNTNKANGRERNELRGEYSNISGGGSTPNPNNTGVVEQLRDNGNRKEKNKGRKRQSQSKFGQIGGDVTNTKRSGGKRKHKQEQEQREFRGCDSETFTNANSSRQPSEEHREKKSGRFTKESLPNDWENFPTQSPICNGNDGLPTELDGITFPKWRNESIKAGGNAVVPQVVHQIFKSIEQWTQRHKHF